MKKIILVMVMVFCVCGIALGNASLIPSDATQSNLAETYKFVRNSAESYWLGNSAQDLSIAAGHYGELPILWDVTGENRGSFIYPDTLSSSRTFDFDYNSTFNISDIEKSYSLNIPTNRSVAILKSSVRDNMEQSVSWQYSYFKSFIENYIGWNADDNIRVYYDSSIVSISSDVRLLIIPAFEYSSPLEYYIEQSALLYNSNLTTALTNYLDMGGTIYAEGNAGYLLEALGLLPEGTYSFDDVIDGPAPTMMSTLTVEDSDHPMAFSTAENQLYTVTAPTLSEDGNVILRYAETFNPSDIGKPACVEHIYSNGKILLMASTPTAEMQAENMQWQFTANAFLSAFASKMSLSRSVYTGFVTDSVDIAPFSLPVGQPMEFEITIRVRNLWNEPITDAVIVESLDQFFEFTRSTSGVSPTVSDQTLTFSLPTIPANSEYEIVYHVTTPDEDNEMWNDIDDYLDWQEYMYISTSYMTYTDPDHDIEKLVYRRSLFAKFLFEADIVADTDLNWKNILGEYYQPFKIFMIMENKERTSAFNTVYTQYIPRDVPIYWVDPMSIPIIRTPGGEFVDLLIDGNDMDSDGDPDSWLDMASFQVEPTRIEEVEIYWKNPWNNLYEDFDKDGNRAQDTDGDGVVDIEEPGDMIRAYKCEWDMNEIPGFQFYDPYVSWELWIDPPPLVDMAIGASIREGFGYTGEDTDGYYYDGWENWMEHTDGGELIYAHLVLKTIDSYRGFIFADSSYELGFGDSSLGWIPKPREEYIAVLNLGGREPTMTSPIPPEEDTLYGKITYETLWGNHKTFPIRTSYTYYAPLPNPLQFEYISATFEITDPGTGAEMDYLPAYDDANITYHLTASTEYSYYWILAVGQDFGEFGWSGDTWTQYSTDEDGLGDGVFGYMIQEIPKGFGDYYIDLPRNTDGSFDIDAIVPEFEPFLFDHDSVALEVEIWETPFYYSVYIPQILMPPALDDDNFDMVDDWLDDIGDRFVSSTGCLHDIWPPNNCDAAEAIYATDPWDITTPIEGDLAWPHEGWYWGEDNAYGDDLIEELGQYKISVNAQYHGSGQEGQILINRGVWLVNEEIFGGSPWVQFSHAQSAPSKGNNIRIQRGVDPYIVSLYPDSVLMRWRIYEANEPHTFDILFDPFVETIADDEVAISIHVGGKEPTSMFTTDYVSHARIDPDGWDAASITVNPDAAAVIQETIPGFDPTYDGGILQVLIEVDNNTPEDWYFVNIMPDLTSLGASSEFLWYSAYPRPLVPTSVDPATGDVIEMGDDPTVFHAGWRFNASDLEVLNKVGNPDGSAEIPQIMSSRRAYYIFHFAIDPSLADGIYEIPFELTGTSRAYYETGGTPIEYEVPTAKFAVVTKNSSGVTISNPEFVIGTADLSTMTTNIEDYVSVPDPTTAFKWFETGWPSMTTFITSGTPTSGTVSGSSVDIRLPYTEFPPSPDETEFYVGAMSVVDAPYGSDWLALDDGAIVNYTDILGIPRTRTSPVIGVEARGSQMLVRKTVQNVNGIDILTDGNFVLQQGTNEMTIELVCANKGNDIARNITLYAQLGNQAEYVSSDDRYDVSYDPATRMVEWTYPFEIYPGAVRSIPITVSVEKDDSYDAVDIMYAFISEFTDEDDVSDARFYREMDSDTIRYSADFSINDNDIIVNPAEYQLDDEVEISATVKFSGNMYVANPKVRIFENEEQIGEDIIITELSPRDTMATISFPFNISSYYHNLFITVDPDEEILESNESNNIAQIELITNSGNIVEDIVVYPTPFDNYAEFTYVVTKPVKKNTLKVFTVKGRLVRDFGEIPSALGYNFFGWDGSDDKGDQIGNGTYVYKIYAEDFDGESYEKIERLVRMR